MTELRDELQATLGSAYALERELGGGGMSRVFVAHETRLGRRVVVKVLPPDLAAGISAARFEREIKLAASLQQANIVPVLSAGDMNGLPFYTMPFVDGESLRARLAKGPPLAIPDVLRILGDVARALQYAHEHGTVHRDIKPDNVLLSGGTAVVTDFGIARALYVSRTEGGAGNTLTQTGTSIGTPAYMAPEQAAGDPALDHRADIYAFGCMAYELLGGQPPFHDRTPQRVVAAHMTEAPREIAEIRSDVPAPLATLVMRCLAKEPADRPASAANVVRTLDSIASGDGKPRRSRKALILYASAAAAVIALGMLLARAFGIGPAATLFSSGAMKAGDRVLVADFESPPSDTSLGSVVTEGVRGNLAQSRAIAIVPASQINAALVRMQKPAAARLDPATAKEMAQREGYKAIVDGKLTSVAGGQFILTARIVAAETGDELASVREVARDAPDLIPAIDKVTKALRRKLGESLGTVRAAPSLARATTASLPALRKYTEAVRANGRDQNFLKAIAAYEEAIRLDSTFAMAYRGAAVSYQNARLDPERSTLFREKAFQYRERLPDIERAFVEGTYYNSSHHADRQKEIEAYQRALELDPTNDAVLNALGLAYRTQHDWIRAESAYKASAAHDSTSPFPRSNFAMMLAYAGRTEEATRAWDDHRRRFPQSPTITAPVVILAQRAGIDSARIECARYAQTGNPLQRSQSQACLAWLDMTYGRIASSMTGTRRTFELDSARGVRTPGFDLLYRASDALAKAWLLDRKEEAVRILDALAPKVPLVNPPPALDTMPGTIVKAYAIAGRPDKARAFFDKWMSGLDTAGRRLRTTAIHLAQARIALAERKYDVAIREFTAADTWYDGQPSACAPCALPEIGIAHDLAGRHADAIRAFEAYLAVPLSDRWIYSDPTYLAGVYKRLGELYDEKNDTERAASYYRKFIDLWKNADPELQPRVAEARARLAQVQKREARTR